MKRSRAGVLAIFGLALSLTAAVDGPLAKPPPDASGADPPQVAARAGLRQQEVLRSWQDRVKVDGRDELRTVEIVFDYSAGEAHRRVFDAAGQLLSEEVLANQPRPTTSEIAEAIDIVRRDPELGRLARDKRANFAGGFLLREREGEPCGPPARCLQILMLSESYWELLRRPVVDLGQRGRIAHRHYVPRRNTE
jgi:hypothetical protein